MSSPSAASVKPYRVRGRAYDIRVAAAVGFVQIAGSTLAARHHEAPYRGLDLLAYAVLLVGPAALLFRQRAPAAVLVTAFGATLAYDLLGYSKGPVFLSLIVALFTAVTRGRRLVAWVVLGAGYFSFVWLAHWVGHDPAPTLGAMLGVPAWLLILLTVSEVVRTRRERAAEAWRAREEEARRRASEERLRIARELHDVLAHNISLINVQAGVALHLLDDQPGQARSALTAIKQASKEALGELRSVLDVLRQEGESPPRSPTAGLDHLEQLVSRAEAAGIAVRTEVDGSPRLLPAGVDLAAYRIVQEALTNVARHAGPASATVRVAYGEGEVVVQVDDDGRGPGTNGLAGGGNGIPGMRERATALGGLLEAGPRPGGGFRVRARLPAGDGA